MTDIQNTPPSPKGRGFFIVFEGGEGTGKSTQIKALENYLLKKNFQVLVTWEPGGTPLGEKIRSLLIDPASSPMNEQCEALLYAAARAQHVSQKILPKLQEGFIVLCDRYIDASKAYQGVGRNLGIKPVEDLNSWATGGLNPDRVYLFDADPKIGLKRAEARGALDRIEREPLTFHESIREAYIYSAQKEPERYKIIHVPDRSVESITQELVEDFELWITAKLKT